MGRASEAQSIIDFHKLDSAYHRALHISYPDSKDKAFTEAAGKPVGGAIMIHGLRNGMGLLGPIPGLTDWTEGCVAVTNAEIEELWDAIPDGTPIEIRP